MHILKRKKWCICGTVRGAGKIRKEISSVSLRFRFQCVRFLNKMKYQASITIYVIDLNLPATLTFSLIKALLMISLRR